MRAWESKGVDVSRQHLNHDERVRQGDVGHQTERQQQGRGGDLETEEK